MSGLLTLPVIGQSGIKYAKRNGLSVQLPSGWTIIQESDADEIDNLYYLKVKKELEDEQTWLVVWVRLDLHSDNYNYYDLYLKYNTSLKVDTVSIGKITGVRHQSRQDISILDDIQSKGIEKIYLRLVGCLTIGFQKKLSLF